MKRLSLLALFLLMACGDAITPTEPDSGLRKEVPPDLPVSYDPGIRVAPETHDFGDVIVGHCASGNIDVSNLWWGDLSLSSVVLGDESDPAFSLLNAPTSGDVVRPGSSLWFEVVFCPTVTGAHGGVVKIPWTNGETGVSIVELFGTGIVLTTPEEHIDWLIDEVEDLVTEGTLNEGQGNALASKLENALKSLAKGNTKAAINQLRAFITPVDAFVRSGKLTEEEGQDLIDAAQAAIDLLSSG
jgi:polyhydroxyalkanoate synthesis regulator phasin